MKRLVLAHWQYELAVQAITEEGEEPTLERLEAWVEDFFGEPVAIDVVRPFLTDS